MIRSQHERLVERPGASVSSRAGDGFRVGTYDVDSHPFLALASSKEAPIDPSGASRFVLYGRVGPWNHHFSRKLGLVSRDYF